MKSHIPIQFEESTRSPLYRPASFSRDKRSLQNSTNFLKKPKRLRKRITIKVVTSTSPEFIPQNQNLAYTTNRRKFTTPSGRFFRYLLWEVTMPTATNATPAMAMPTSVRTNPVIMTPRLCFWPWPTPIGDRP